MRLLVLLAAFPLFGIDLRHASVSQPPGASAREKKAAAALIEEVEKRTGIRWTAAPGQGPVISLERGQGPAEGYRIAAEGSRVRVTGNDERGILFGAGRLLRLLDMAPGQVSLPDGFSVATAPKYPLRGHQLGYRPKTNSYDAWNLAQWEQYIRDLAVFGANAVELIPPRSDDDADSPHFPAPPMEMMAGMSRLLDEYWLDVWIWNPAMDKDYGDPATVESALKE